MILKMLVVYVYKILKLIHKYYYHVVMFFIINVLHLIKSIIRLIVVQFVDIKIMRKKLLIKH